MKIYKHSIRLKGAYGGSDEVWHYVKTDRSKKNLTIRKRGLKTADCLWSQAEPVKVGFWRWVRGK